MSTYVNDCLFCKIAKKEVPCSIIFENDHVIAFKDLYPQAREHYLFISKNHTRDINQLSENVQELTRLFHAIKVFTQNHSKLAKNGFRVVTNQGKDGGQTIFHTHLHVLGGEKLGSFGA